MDFDQWYFYRVNYHSIPYDWFSFAAFSRAANWNSPWAFNYTLFLCILDLFVLDRIAKVPLLMNKYKMYFSRSIEIVSSQFEGDLSTWMINSFTGNLLVLLPSNSWGLRSSFIFFGLFALQHNNWSLQIPRFIFTFL